MVLRFVTLIDL